MRNPRVNSSVPHHHEMCSTLHHCDVHLIARPDKDFAQLNICEPQKQPCDKGELLVMLASYLEPSFQTNLASRSQPRRGVYPYTIPIHTQVRWLHLGVKSPIQNPNPVEELEQRARPTTLDLTGHKRPREIQCYAKFPIQSSFYWQKPMFIFQI